MSVGYHRLTVVAKHLETNELASAVPVQAAPVAAVYSGWTCDPTVRLPRFTGDGSEESVLPETFPAKFRKRVEAMPDRVHLRAKRSHDQTEWSEWTWADYHAEVMAVAAGLISLGFKRHDISNILAFNSPEWFISAMGTIFAGGLAAGIYTTNSPPAVEYILQHSKAKLIFVDTQAQLDKVCEVKDRCPDCRWVVTFPFPWGGQVPATSGNPTWLLGWGHLQSAGGNRHQEVEIRIQGTFPDHACYLSYTSGTTGNPKAVMYSHDNLIYGMSMIEGACLEMMTKHAFAKNWGTLEERVVPILPLCHIGGCFDFFDNFASPLSMATIVHFPFPDAMAGTLTKTLVEVKPTRSFFVPRVWEKFQSEIQALEQKGVPREKWLESVGLDKLKVAKCGAAPINDKTHRFFEELGIPLYEGYGMTENAAVGTWNFPGARKIGTIGVPNRVSSTNDAQIICDPSTGEILTRSRSTMMGYMYNEEKTVSTIDAEGWVHTGDVGTVDADGFFKITGRIKEMIITAGGENTAPVLIEEICKKEMPAIANMMVVGDRQKYLIALVTLKTNPDPSAPKGFSDNLILEAAAVDSSVKTVTQAKSSLAFDKYFKEGFDRANKKIISRAQNIRKFAILPRDFSPLGANAELTQTMKLRRDWVHVNFKEVIKNTYGADYADMLVFGEPL